jgi:hypothetical protein
MPVRQFNRSLFVFYIIGLLLVSGTNQAHGQAESSVQIWSNESYPDSIRFEAFNRFYTDHIHAQPSAILERVDAHYSLAKESKNPSEIANAIRFMHSRRSAGMMMH